MPFDWRGLLLSTFVLALAGWAAAGTPFRGDQALFAENARRLQDGAALYRDVWDVANPNVFWFYQLAGTCFGFNEDGIHLFEWLYWVVFVQVVSFAVKRAHALNRWPLSPSFLIGGVYYLTSCSEPSHLTKVEGLVAFPLFLSAWLVSVAIETNRLNLWMLFLAGLAAGAVLLFKFAFVACVLAAWVPGTVIAFSRRQWWKLLALPCGLLFVLGLATVHFVIMGVTEEASRTFFVIPREMLKVAKLAGFDRLAHSIRWLAETHSPVFALAVFGTIAALCRRFDPLVISLVLILVAAVPVVLIQRWSWWSYHMLLIGVPLSVLASVTWPVTIREVTIRLNRPFTVREKWVVSFVGLALFLPVLGHGANAYLRLASHHFGITTNDRAAARVQSGLASAVAATETEWLHQESARPGPIFVAGDPLFHILSGRRMCTAIHGWSLELITPELWQDLFDQLRVARPIYVFIDKGYAELIEQQLPELRLWLASDYSECRNSVHGTWYERR